MTNVLTLCLDADSQAHFDRLRTRHFPPDRNLIPAHLTLFHTLPDQADVSDLLEAEAKGTSAFSLRVTGVRSLGKGVAYRLESDPLQALHRRLANAFDTNLSAQDRQRLQPHIVVQNKATVSAARELLAELQQGFVEREVHALGLNLWHYLGGPWQLARNFPFQEMSR